MRELTHILVIAGLLMLASCSRTPPAKVTEPLPATPATKETNVTPLTDINLATIGNVAPKGRVQDPDYNDLPVVTSLIKHGKDAIPYLISKLADKTEIEGHVFDYWSEVRVGDVALVILTDFFLDSSWQKTTIPEASWNNFLERGSNRDLTGEEVLRNYISKHGRKAIKDRWQKIWSEYRDKLYWDENELCFKVPASSAPEK